MTQFTSLSVIGLWPQTMPRGAVTSGAYPYRTICGTDLRFCLACAADLYHRRPTDATPNMDPKPISQALDGRAWPFVAKVIARPRCSCRSHHGDRPGRPGRSRRD